MAEEAPIAVAHLFEAPNAFVAQEIASALTRFGFSNAEVFLELDGYWTIRAIDIGPYGPDQPSQQAIKALGRAASAVARRCGGQHRGQIEFSSDAQPDGRAYM